MPKPATCTVSRLQIWPLLMVLRHVNRQHADTAVEATMGDATAITRPVDPTRQHRYADLPQRLNSGQPEPGLLQQDVKLAGFLAAQGA